MMITEFCFDGLVGPTHHFGGMGVGNLASKQHRGECANPQAAALQGLDKMALLHSIGVTQAILPPHPRPSLDLLRSIGFHGPGEEMVHRAGEQAPWLLSAAYSASSMWTANAATVTRTDATGDRRVHLTPANLVSSIHRAIESRVTAGILHEVFDSDHFCIHEPLPPANGFRDEGAANHMRLSDRTGAKSLDLFVYGETLDAEFPARQSLAASQAVARLHRLPPERTFFLRQSSEAIQAGAFHNDVVATSHRNVLLYHQQAFDQPDEVLEQIQKTLQPDAPLYRIEVSTSELSLQEAIDCYLFNCQIVDVSQDDESLAIICPIQCQQHAGAGTVVERIVRGDNPIAKAHFVDLRQSMNNGGGPACLRLRVPVDPNQAAGIKPSVMWSPALDAELRELVKHCYPTSLEPKDLADAGLLSQCDEVNHRIAKLFGIRSISPQ